MGGNEIWFCKRRFTSPSPRFDFREEENRQQETKTAPAINIQRALLMTGGRILKYPGKGQKTIVLL